MLISLGGLPATGKSTLAQALARADGAVHLRVDTIEQAVVHSGVAARPLGPVGYVVGYALAEEQLRLGLTVVAESVNLPGQKAGASCRLPSLRGCCSLRDVRVRGRLSGQHPSGWWLHP